MTSCRRRVLTLDAALTWRQALRRDGMRLALTNGCFDLLHAGHVDGLEAARAEGDALVVLVNSDASVRRLKGSTRPIVPQRERALLLASLRCVDAVVVFESTDCAAEIEALEPDCYVKSEEYRDAQNPAEKAALERVEAQVWWVRRVPGFSTTEILDRIAGTAAVPSRVPAGHTDLTGTPDWGCP